jgi:predicted acylesterase/phospholipase RssA
MGAYVAAVWAFGHNGATMEKLAREVEGRWTWLRLLDPVLVPRSGLLRGEKMRRRLKASIGDAQFSDLVRPLRIVATNLHSLERVVFSSGEVAARGAGEQRDSWRVRARAHRRRIVFSMAAWSIPCRSMSRVKWVFK